MYPKDLQESQYTKKWLALHCLFMKLYLSTLKAKEKIYTFYFEMLKLSFKYVFVDLLLFLLNFN